MGGHKGRAVQVSDLGCEWGALCTRVRGPVAGKAWVALGPWTWLREALAPPRAGTGSPAGRGLHHIEVVRPVTPHAHGGRTWCPFSTPAMSPAQESQGAAGHDLRPLGCWPWLSVSRMVASASGLSPPGPARSGAASTWPVAGSAWGPALFVFLYEL